MPDFFLVKSLNTIDKNKSKEKNAKNGEDSRAVHAKEIITKLFSLEW